MNADHEQIAREMIAEGYGDDITADELKTLVEKPVDQLGRKDDMELTNKRDATATHGDHPK